MFKIANNFMKNCFYSCVKCFTGVTLVCLFLLSFQSTVFSETIAVMPFFKGQKTDTAISAIDTVIKNFSYSKTNLSSNADITMTKLVHKALEKKSYQVIPMETVLSAYQLLLDKAQDCTPLTLAIQLGKALNADYVVAGNVWRFRERSGTALASTHPASVGFKIHLISINANNRIWKGVVDTTQQSLSENLLKAKDFIKQGARWLTAEELAMYELDNILKEFPIKQEKY